MVSIASQEQEDMEYDGVAYALFDSSAPRKSLESTLEGIRKLDDFPSDLKLSLGEVRELQQDGEIDPTLMRFINSQSIYPTFPPSYIAGGVSGKPILLRDLKYMIRANYQGETNSDVAHYLGETVMNTIYQKHEEGKPFVMAVVAKNEGEYMFTRN